MNEDHKFLEQGILYLKSRNKQFTVIELKN